MDTALEELYLWVVERAPHQGARWFNGLDRAVLSLSDRPRRCPIAPESVDPESPVRVLHCGRKPHVDRIFFVIDEQAETVHVVHVRRGARPPATAAELKSSE